VSRSTQEEERSLRKGVRIDITRISPTSRLSGDHLVHLFACLTYGTGASPAVHIVRNVAWNDFISQINFLQTTLRKILRQRIARCSEVFSGARTEVRVGVYDLEVFRAIDQARALLQKADRDLETLRKEAVLQGSASKAWEVTCGIQDSHRLQQV